MEQKIEKRVRSVERERECGREKRSKCATITNSGDLLKITRIKFQVAASRRSHSHYSLVCLHKESNANSTVLPVHDSTVLPVSSSRFYSIASQQFRILQYC